MSGLRSDGGPGGGTGNPAAAPGGHREGRFAGRVALVTGAGSGIGAAVARRLAAEGAAAVVLADIDPRAAEAVAAGRPGSRPVAVDVADAGQVDACVEETVRRHGRLDVAVHAAGVDDPVAKEWIAQALLSGEAPEVTTRIDPAMWQRVTRTNLDGTFHVLRAVLRAMVPNRSGAVVTVGSSSAFDAPVGYPHYAASKAGAHALSQAVAKEAIAFGVRVNTVAPGPTDTGMAARTPEALRQGFRDPRVRPYATADEIAAIAAFLASDDAANLVGAVLLANGGRFTT